MIFHFVNTDTVCLAAYESVLSEELPSRFIAGSIADHAHECDAFVSASNSRLCFDGGSDLDYIALLGDPRPALYKTVQAFMDARPGVFGNSNVVHLPVGAALIYRFGDRALIAAPTMILPQPVPDTQNAYFAFKMVLELLDKHGYDHVLVPGLCTGIGKMDAHESARQILRAWREHQKVSVSTC